MVVAMAAVGVVDDVTSGAAISMTSSSSSSPGWLSVAVTVVVLGAVILSTVVGNTFVIAAVLVERNLRGHVANFLVASLAVADLLVATLVMPLAAVNEVRQHTALRARHVARRGPGGRRPL